MLRHPLKARLLIADDHEIFLDGLSSFLQSRGDMELVGMAKNGQELVALAEELQPHAILTDIQMPVMDGAEATKAILARRPDTPVIALSSYGDDQSVFDMLNAGVKGYLLKHAHKCDIMGAVYAVLKGEVWYCREISEAMLRVLQLERHSEEVVPAAGDFSERDRQIIDLICRQKSNKEMANELGISVRTVESRRIGIFHKLNVRTPAGVVIYAIKNGLFDPEAQRKK